MELNREQIIKALECCIEVNCGSIAVCPYREKFKNCFECQANLKKEALALIKELTEENEAWQKQLISTKEQADKAYYDLACEVEDLRAENEKLHASCTELTRKMQDNVRTENEELRKSSECDARKLKADTVRKMHSEIKERCIKGGIYPAFVASTIDQIEKEMLEEKQ